MPPLFALIFGEAQIVDHMIHGFLVLVQKDSIAKKESYWHGTLKIVYRVYTHKKAKRENESFYVISTILCFPD
jgi:hypothetical protein